MKIRLQIRLSDDVTLEGAQLDAPLPAAQRQALRAMPYLAGTVWIEHDDQPSLEILDDLEQLVPRLCIWSRPALEAGGPVTVDMFASAERVTLEPRGKQLRATATWQVEALLPTAEFIAELRRVARQFLHFLELNLAQEPAWQEKIDDLRLTLRGMGEALTTSADPEPPAAPEPGTLSDQEMKEILAEQAKRR
jgi:hypothetical protein